MREDERGERLYKVAKSRRKTRAPVEWFKV